MFKVQESTIEMERWVARGYKAQRESERVVSRQVELQKKDGRRMERRAVEQWSDREVEVGVLIREEQAPLSPCPPDTHMQARTEDH